MGCVGHQRHERSDQHRVLIDSAFSFFRSATKPKPHVASSSMRFFHALNCCGGVVSVRPARTCWRNPL
ncbi:hypothetical protein RB3398 [Rhodopirellula baltica SH 1]|uniref:Uncharacterized protein n=1 Tax=Rhodopirellula baltica (strain DSM 10527 / NCIMB 13988 / SH1) TaxID=243090 RepID=Q7UUB3_RHOBA|nr:hypothetical protein RB3398 [Rhodopirellula baltica SH 1]